MKKKELLYAIICALGGGIVSSCASKLNELYGSILFTVGILLIVFSISKLNK